MASPKSGVLSGSEGDITSSAGERSEEQLGSNFKETPLLSSIESLPVEIKLLIFCHLDRRSDLNALRITSTTFHLIYRNNIRVIQAAIVLNSLRNDGSDGRKFGLCLRAAILSFDCIPLLQGMKTAYKEFHKPPPTQRGVSLSRAQRMFWLDWVHIIDFAINALTDTF